LLTSQRLEENPGLWFPNTIGREIYIVEESKHQSKGNHVPDNWRHFSFSIGYPP
jgi:hypothetical protein